MAPGSVRSGAPASPAAHQALSCPRWPARPLDLSPQHPLPLRVELPGRARLLGQSSHGFVAVDSNIFRTSWKPAPCRCAGHEGGLWASHTWSWAHPPHPRLQPGPRKVHRGTMEPPVRPHPHTSPRPQHQPQDPRAGTLSPPAQRGAPSLSLHLVWADALWGVRTAARGPPASLTPGASGRGDTCRTVLSLLSLQGRAQPLTSYPGSPRGPGGPLAGWKTERKVSLLLQPG